MKKVDVQRLIRLIRSHECLYNSNHKDYKNIGLKSDLWDVIAAELNQHVSVIKLKWKTIKDGYLKYKKQVQAAGSDKKIREYVWKNHLAFLDCYKVTRMTRLSKNSQGEASPTHETEFTASGSLLDPLTSDGSRTGNDVLQDSIPSTSRAAKRQRVDTINQTTDEPQDPKPNDAVKLLFESYAKTFKTLTCRQRAHIKIEMAKLFANAELDLNYNTQKMSSQAFSNQYKSTKSKVASTKLITHYVRSPKSSASNSDDEEVDEMETEYLFDVKSEYDE